MSQELVICSICVCSTSTNVEHTLLIMLMLLDEFRVTKQEEAQNLHRHAILFFFSYKNNRKSTKGKRKRECAIKTENEAAAREDDEDAMRVYEYVIAWQRAGVATTADSAIITPK